MEAVGRSSASRRWLWPLVLIVASLAAAHLVDWWAHLSLADPGLADEDLGRMLRIMGFLPFWIVAALALGLCDDAHAAGPRRRRHARGLMLFGGAALGGLVAELMKLAVRRERPNAEIGEYVFRDWAERPFHTGGLGLASSHAGVAFGAAFMLARIFPRARGVWYGLGAGCAFSRVAAGAHFVSDVVMAAVLAYGVVALLWWRWGAAADAVARTRHPTSAVEGSGYPGFGMGSAPERA
jgi:membrane-associated phospholipid phosphatase